MEAATAPDGTRIELSYDPFARRVRKRVYRPTAREGKRVLSALTRFVWDGDALVHEIRRSAQASGDPVVEERTYCFEDDGFEPVAHREQDEWFHYVNDPVGTPERLVDERGQVACELRRSAWGKVEVDEEARASTPIRFQGQYEDEETGLCYNRFRYYDPEAGRFISSDPIGLQGGLNSFAYAPNPQEYVDPFGLAFFSKKSRRHIEHRHVNKNKFKTKGKWKGGQYSKETERAIAKPDRSCKQADGRTVYERDFHRTVGQDPDGPVTKVRVVVESSGEIVTAFPQRNFM